MLSISLVGPQPDQLARPVRIRLALGAVGLGAAKHRPLLASTPGPSQPHQSYTYMAFDLSRQLWTSLTQSNLMPLAKALRAFENLQAFTTNVDASQSTSDVTLIVHTLAPNCFRFVKPFANGKRYVIGHWQMVCQRRTVRNLALRLEFRRALPLYSSEGAG